MTITRRQARKDRLTFKALNEDMDVLTGQGDRCVFIQVVQSGAVAAGVVFSSDEAEAFGRSLIRRARYSRIPEAGAERG